MRPLKIDLVMPFRLLAAGFAMRDAAAGTQERGRLAVVATAVLRGWDTVGSLRPDEARLAVDLKPMDGSDLLGPVATGSVQAVTPVRLSLAAGSAPAEAVKSV